LNTLAPTSVTREDDKAKFSVENQHIEQVNAQAYFSLKFERQAALFNYRCHRNVL